MHENEFVPNIELSEPFDETFPFQFGWQASEQSAEAEVFAGTYEEVNLIGDMRSVDGVVFAGFTEYSSIDVDLMVPAESGSLAAA